MLKVTPFEDVTRIDSSRSLFGQGYYWTTAYWLDGLLVDTGCAHTAGELLKQLADRPLTRIVNTHSHEDHFGANSLLQTRRAGVPIFAHPLALPVLENPRLQPLQLYRRVFWGWPGPCNAKPLADGETFQVGKYTFQVIYTPGHSPDHLCLYEPTRGWLFSGDLYVGGRDRALREDYDIWQIIASLKRIAALPLTRLFPGSAQVREDPIQALHEKIAYLEEVGEKVLYLHQQDVPEYAIAQVLFGGSMLVELVTGGNFSRRGLVRSFLKHKKV